MTLVLIAALLAGGSVAARRSEPGEILLDRGDPTISATIAGVPATLAVMPDVGTALSAPFAARLAVTWRQGQRIDIGRVALAVRASSTTAQIAGQTMDIDVTTSDAPCCRGHDGGIGAADLPWRAVRIGRAGALSERRFRTQTGGRDGLSIPVRIGKETLHVILAPDNPETVATAAAAAMLARAYGGQLEPATRSVPILFGIARPVRDMAFARPVPLLGFTLSRIAVRIADFAGVSGALRDVDPAAQATPATGGDEIVVAHRPLPPQYGWAAVTIGRDLLDRCPMIAIYPEADEIGLACAPS